MKHFLVVMTVIALHAAVAPALADDFEAATRRVATVEPADIYPELGGTSIVQIHGVGFAAGTQVVINGYPPITPTSIEPHKLVVRLPHLSAGIYDLRVRWPGEATDLCVRVPLTIHEPACQLEPVRFPFGSDQITNVSQEATLERNIACLARSPARRFVVLGFASAESPADDKVNDHLARSRAKAISRFIQARLPYMTSATVSLGHRLPVTPGRNTQEHDENRRAYVISDEPPPCQNVRLELAADGHIARSQWRLREAVASCFIDRDVTTALVLVPSSQDDQAKTQIRQDLEETLSQYRPPSITGPVIHLAHASADDRKRLEHALSIIAATATPTKPDGQAIFHSSPGMAPERDRPSASNPSSA
ncbi:MAG: OmpA family protein [Minicystis sp.]